MMALPEGDADGLVLNQTVWNTCIYYILYRSAEIEKAVAKAKQDFLQVNKEFIN